MRVLLITSPQPESAWLFKALQESAHSLQRVDDLRDGIFVASQESFDAIVVVSSESRPLSGLLDALPTLSREGNGAAVIVTLGHANPRDRTKILRAGADACFSQPVSFIEMHERLLALRRAKPYGTTQDALASATPALDPATREFVAGGHRIVVTRREYMLLECLLRQPNAPVARERVIRYAWPEQEDVDPSSVNLAVSRLRRKLLPHAPAVQIETVSRYGYQITTIVR
jgi:two-component system, OmpR family, response regulator